MKHLHPRWKHIGAIGKYALCIIDSRNYGIYCCTEGPVGYKDDIGYYGDLGNALQAMLKRLIRDRASEECNGIMALIEIVIKAEEEVLAFGRELDKALQS